MSSLKTGIENLEKRLCVPKEETVVIVKCREIYNSETGESETFLEEKITILADGTTKVEKIIDKTNYYVIE